MESRDSKVVGTNIRIMRQMLGISQEAIAIKLNISQAAYSKMESGIIPLTEERLKIILSEFNIRDRRFIDINFNEVIKDILNM